MNNLITTTTKTFVAALKLALEEAKKTLEAQYAGKTVIFHGSKDSYRYEYARMKGVVTQIEVYQELEYPELLAIFFTVDGVSYEVNHDEEILVVEDENA